MNNNIITAPNLAHNRWKLGMGSDPEDILLYNIGIEYILLPYSSSSSFFGSHFVFKVC